MKNRTYNVLFLCTGNSARSILAEAILNRVGRGRFRAYSAGSRPKGEVHPLALELLRFAGDETAAFRSKSWDEFARAGAPEFDFIFTVCGNAAAEQCPVWPGHPITADWGTEDPAAVDGPREQQLQAFQRAYAVLNRRIELLVNLPDASLDRLGVQSRLDAIGKVDAPSSEER